MHAGSSTRLWTTLTSSPHKQELLQQTCRAGEELHDSSLHSCAKNSIRHPRHHQARLCNTMLIAHTCSNNKALQLHSSTTIRTPLGMNMCGIFLKLKNTPRTNAQPWHGVSTSCCTYCHSMKAMLLLCLKCTQDRREGQHASDCAVVAWHIA